jgi:hypothetical protein
VPKHLLRAAAVAVLSAACQTAPPGPVIDSADDCQPILGGADCLLPYPSDFFARPDPTRPNHRHVQIGAMAAPQAASGEPANPLSGLGLDGFSRLPLITTVVPAATADDALPGILAPAQASTSPNSPTLLIDTVTGKGVPHFADLAPADERSGLRAVAIHPLVALAPSTRYVVALQQIRAGEGGVAAAPAGFAALRDGAAANQPALAPLVEHFDRAIFPITTAYGVPRTDLQQAWDFTTRSDATARADMDRVCSLTLQWLRDHGPDVVVREVTELPEAPIWRQVRGVITGPRFVDSEQPGGSLVRNSRGETELAGTLAFEFVAQIPISVRDQPGPGRAVTFGHGFFASRDESVGPTEQAIFDELRAVSFAIDWMGLAAADRIAVAHALTSRPGQAAAFAEPIHQAMANWLVLSAAIAGPLAREPAFQRPAGQPAAGEPVYDPSVQSFLGISMGHFMGGVMAALNPYLEHVMLNVGGAGIAHVVTRSQPFQLFVQLLHGSLATSMDLHKYLALLADALERIDGVTYADDLSARRVLMQVGLGDASVPNFVSFIHARSLDLTIVGPLGVAIDDLQVADEPHVGSALAAYDFGISPQVYEPAAAPPANPVHEAVRSLPSAVAQMKQFLAREPLPPAPQ